MSKYIPHDDCNPRTNAGISYLFIGVVVGMAFMAMTRCEREPMPEVVKTSKAECIGCHNRQAHMTAWFKAKGSRSPEEMALAVLQSKRNSRLLAAVASVESGGNPRLRGTGYKKRHHGAYQVNPRYWHGTVPASAAGQTMQAEAILEELTATMPIQKALSIYGGDSTPNYQRKILAALQEVP